MNIYQANGVRLGLLLLPQERAVKIWRGGQQGVATRLQNANRLDGSELAEGLALDLEEIWVDGGCTNHGHGRPRLGGVPHAFQRSLMPIASVESATRLYNSSSSFSNSTAR
jgi:hypothetical protein